MSIPTYSPKRLIVTINGVQITGFGDSDIITVALDEDKFAKFVSVDGPVSRSHNVSSSGTFTITLAQTSGANEVLSTLLNLDTLDASGNATFSVSVIDANSKNKGTSYTSKNCWVRGMPESPFSKEVTERVWVIDAENISFGIVGNGINVLSGLQNIFS
jgi:hypothetical protein